MKKGHSDHDYSKLWKDPLEKYLSVFSTRFALSIAIFTFTMRSTFTLFFTFQNRKKHHNLAF